MVASTTHVLERVRGVVADGTKHQPLGLSSSGGSSWGGNNDELVFLGGWCCVIKSYVMGVGYRWSDYLEFCLQ